MEQGSFQVGHDPLLLTDPPRDLTQLLLVFLRRLI
jgi:hypothetical protein